MRETAIHHIAVIAPHQPMYHHQTNTECKLGALSFSV